MLEGGLDFIRPFKALVDVTLFSPEGGIGGPRPVVAAPRIKHLPRESLIDSPHQIIQTVGLKMSVAASGCKLKLFLGACERCAS